jgi:hypothetical protein
MRRLPCSSGMPIYSVRTNGERRSGKYRNGDACGVGRYQTKNGQNADKSKKAAYLVGPKSMIALVAGGGFEPPTFGL